MGNKIIKKMGINNIILQASLSHGETGFTLQGAQLDIGGK